MKVIQTFFFLGVIVFSVLLSCTSTPSDSEAQKIIDASIEAHGGSSFQDVALAFDFRKRHYTYQRKGGEFVYTREFSDSTGQVKDILTNTGFTRLQNGDTVQLSSEREKAFTNSVNSVLYFAVLPYGLNDAAAQKTYIGRTEIKGRPYHLIRVHFSEEGGGEDFEDEFLYWINAQTYTMDYLGYSYHTEGGGLRFREAINPRQLGGIRFQDYLNYKPITEHATLDSLEVLYKRGALELLSEIELENIGVNKARD